MLMYNFAQKLGHDLINGYLAKKCFFYFQMWNFSREQDNYKHFALGVKSIFKDI